MINYSFNAGKIKYDNIELVFNKEAEMINFLEIHF